MTDRETTIDLLIYDLSQAKAEAAVVAAIERAFKRLDYRDAENNTLVLRLAGERRKAMKR